MGGGMSRERMSPVRRRLWCLAGSVLAFLAGLGLLAYAGYWFVPQVFMVLTRPTAEFDEGEVRVITPESGGRVHVLSLVIESMDDPVPPMEVRVRGLDGAAVEVSEVEGWSR